MPMQSAPSPPAPAAARTRHTARPPGPRGAQVAKVLAQFAAGRPLQASTRLTARYGDTVYLPVRPWEGLYIFSRPDQAEHVLAARQDNYVKSFTYQPLRMLLGDGLLTADETTWRRHRRIIQPLFTTSSIASYAAQMDAAAQRAVRRWDSGPQVTDLTAEMGALALDVTGQALFGTDLLIEVSSMRRLMKDAGQWPVLLGLVLLGAFLPLTPGTRSAAATQALARRLGAGAVQEKVTALIEAGRDQPGATRTLSGQLAAAQDADGSALSDQEIRDEMATFLVASLETTAMALTWTLALLSAHPQVRRQVEDEADAVVGEGPADPARLPWTTAVVSEAMRLYPPAWSLERTAVSDDDVCGATVPAGSMVAVMPWLIHRNPAVWPNPEEFDPNRFLPGAPERHRYAWIPFGGGKRGCIGVGFARQETVLLLARICRHYRIDLVSPALPRPRGHLTLRPAGPVSVRLTRRN
jgi:cytochrome P450